MFMHMKFNSYGLSISFLQRWLFQRLTKNYSRNLKGWASLKLGLPEHSTTLVIIYYWLWAPILILCKSCFTFFYYLPKNYLKCKIVMCLKASKFNADLNRSLAY